MTEPLTGVGCLLGTAAYMSPEQVRGESADARSDLFSAGVVLYEMATGRNPFPGDTVAERITAILRDPPRPATDLSPRVTAGLDRILRRCLEKKPSRRFQSARDLLRELEESFSLDSGSGS